MENLHPIHSNIWKLNIHNILKNLFFAVPIIVLFWTQNGLSLYEIMVLQSLAAFLMVTFEVPTGYFADTFGRKKSLTFSSLSLTTAIIFISLGHNFINFLVAEIFFVLSMALSSGADSALMYETLKDLGEEKHYKKIWGNYMMYGMIALGFSNILGGFIAIYELRWALYASIPFFLISTIAALTLHEPRHHKEIFEKGYQWKLIKNIKEAVLKNKQLFWLILFAGVMFGMNQSGLWLYQPYFELSGLDIVYFGMAFASFHFISGVASKFAHSIEKKIKLPIALLLIAIFPTIGYLLMSHIVFWWSFIFIFFFQFIRGFSNPIISDAIHKVTDSSMRATVLSLQSLMGRLFYALLLPFIGWVADIYSILQALSLLGILTIVFGVSLWGGLWKNKVFNTSS